MNHLRFIMVICAVAVSLGLAGCATDDGGEPVELDIPTDGDKLFSYLQANSYADFAAEPAVHDATLGSPHAKVRTFVNDILEESLKAGNQSHPVGAASVKELYGDDGTSLIGWAVSVKTGDSDNGNGWYWYEIFSTTDGSNPVADGNGVTLCTGCHSGGGADYIRIAYPFE